MHRNKINTNALKTTKKSGVCPFFFFPSFLIYISYKNNASQPRSGGAGEGCCVGWDAVLGTAVPQSLSLHPQHHHHAVLQHQNPVWARPARSNNPAGRGEGNHPTPPSPKVHLLDKSFLSTAFIEKLSCAGQLPSPAWDRGTGTARRVLNIHSVRGFPFAGLALGPQHRWDAGSVPPLPCSPPTMGCRARRG